MEFNYIPLSLSERSIYDCISSEVDKLSTVDLKKLSIEQLDYFCERFRTLLNVKRRIIKNIAGQYKITPDMIITIFDGILFFKGTNTAPAAVTVS